MCLSNGGSGARAPCGQGGEPWSPAQIHVAPCNSSETLGWSMSSSSSAGSSRTAGAAAASGSSWPLPPMDVNALVSAAGVGGPFVDTGIFSGPRASCFPWESDNPAPLVFSNGSTWVMYRSWHPPGHNCTTPIGIARSAAASWNSSYVHGAEPVPIGLYNASGRSYIPLEDPFLYADAAGNFHALFHNMGGCSAVGCHAFSKDGFEWWLASSSPYTSHVVREDGSAIDLARRERPHLVLNAAGDPAFLSNGVQERWDSDHSYTLVQRINAAWP